MVRFSNVSQSCVIASVGYISIKSSTTMMYRFENIKTKSCVSSFVDILQALTEVSTFDHQNYPVVWVSDSIWTDLIRDGKDDVKLQAIPSVWITVYVTSEKKVWIWAFENFHSFAKRRAVCISNVIRTESGIFLIWNFLNVLLQIKNHSIILSTLMFFFFTFYTK